MEYILLQMNDFTSGLSTVAVNFAQLFLRLAPILAGAIFIAESARLWLGRERLRRLLTGSGLWQGRIRAAVLGAMLPFCECGAFPLVLALLRAGVPLGAALTFFIISPIVSIPAFLFLIGLYGTGVALVYLAVTVVLGMAAGSLLSAWADEELVLKKVMRRGTVPEGADCCDMSGEPEGKAECRHGNGEASTPGQTGCCEVAEERLAKGLSGLLRNGLQETFTTLRSIFPITVAAILLASVMETIIPEAWIGEALGFAAPFDVAFAALAGIPIYTGDCTMFAMVAPFIEVTGAIGPGIAFIIAGAGTSINGLVFMSAIFTRRFLCAFVLSVFIIALLAGYLLGVVF